MQPHPERFRLRRLAEVAETFRQGLQTPAGECLLFKYANPALAMWSLAADVLPGVISFAFGLQALVDDLLYVADRARALAKGVLWLAADDPLILDLDGDGIETVGAARSTAYFDAGAGGTGDMGGAVGADGTGAHGPDGTAGVWCEYGLMTIDRCSLGL